MVRTPRPRTERSAAEIAELYQDQVDNLTSCCTRFDRGDTREYRRIALSLRVLVHETAQSRSLLGHAGLRQRRYLNSCAPLHPRNKLGECNLVALVTKPAKRVAIWQANLDSCAMEFVSLKDWWQLPVMAAPEQATLSRADIITFVANQDGGAHVDPGIDAAFETLRRDWFNWSNGKEVTSEVDRHVVRQIGHEMLKSLLPSYRRKKVDNSPHAVTRRIVFASGWGEQPGDLTSYHLTDPDAPCPCLSGRVFRVCHRVGAVAPSAGDKSYIETTAPPDAAFARIGIRTTA